MSFKPEMYNIGDDGFIAGLGFSKYPYEFLPIALDSDYIEIAMIQIFWTRDEIAGDIATLSNDTLDISF